MTSTAASSGAVATLPSSLGSDAVVVSVASNADGVSFAASHLRAFP